MNRANAAHSSCLSLLRCFWDELPFIWIDYRKFPPGNQLAWLRPCRSVHRYDVESPSARFDQPNAKAISGKSYRYCSVGVKVRQPI